MRSVVVTGVSTGIGWGATKVLTKKGFRVFGSVRKAADAERLQKEFGANFVPLQFDVTDEKAARAAADKVRAALNGEKLAGLVNNAGIAVAGPMFYLPVDEFRKQLEVNLTGVVISTQAFGPLLGADPALKGKPGRIVNISSIGGKNASPFMGPYAASKFGLEGLSEALRRELMIFGIDVVIIAPGSVRTAIWDKAEELDVTPYQNTAFKEPLDRVRKYMSQVGAGGLAPERLGRAIHKALTVSNPRVRYTVAPDPVMTFMLRYLPRRTVDNLMAGRLGLKPKNA